MIVKKAYKFRIYPNREQEEYFSKVFGCVRFYWNKALDLKLKNLKEPVITPAKLKPLYPFLKEIDSLALANTQLNLNKAIKDHCKNPKHFQLPKYKTKKHDKQSFTTNNQNNTVKIDFENNRIKIPKLKTTIKAKLHRQLLGKIKSITISKTPTDKYYISILTEEEIKPLKKSKSLCGIDVGIKNFATIAQGGSNIKLSKVDNPKYLSKSEKRLKRLQKQLDRKQHKRAKNDNTKASNNYIKFSKKVAVLYEKTTNQRADFLHKLSKTIINDNQVITVEDLNVKGMLKNHHLAKSISDTGWSIFINMLKYKAKWYGRTFTQVNRFYPSSKTCNICGYIKKDLKLSDRQWVCPVCGAHHDRDINASVNLYRIGQELPEVTPVERGSVDDPTAMSYAKKHLLAEAGSHHFYKWG